MRDAHTPPELLAPAGSLESLRAAVLCKADAIYLGGKAFSARASAENFTESELAQGIKFCHLRGVKVYPALNTEIFRGEMKELLHTARLYAEYGADALIVSDLGAARIIRKQIPDIPLHASTQMTVHTVRGALQARELGFSTVVLARELPLKVIEEICRLDGIRTEVFVHGALCMSVSGQCMMSAFIGSRSANRGRCAQACRLPFTSCKKTQGHALSLKDLSYINRIKELSESGVDSFKIEGRMKRPEYVAAAVTAFRAAVEGRPFDMDSLKAVFSRSGFTDGYLDGKTGAEMFGFRSKEDVTAAAEVLPRLKELYRTEKPIYALDTKLTVRENLPAELTAVCGNISAKAEGDIPERAINRPLTSEYAEKQLKKLGGTVFFPGNTTCDISEELSLSAASLNTLRREAVSECERLITERNTPRYKFVLPDTEYKAAPAKYPTSHKLRIHLPDCRLLKEALELADLVVLPADKCPDTKDTAKIIAAPPPFTLDEKREFSRLEKLREKGYDKLYCHNIAHIHMGRQLGFSMYGSFRLNCVNDETAAALKAMGLSGVTLSYETPMKDIPFIGEGLETGVVVYGNVPVMLTRNCPIRSETGCGKCSGKITDRTGRSFPVVCSPDKEYTEIYNCVRLYMADRLEEIRGADCFEYIFGNETVPEMKSVLKGESPTGEFTRGLYSKKLP